MSTSIDTHPLMEQKQIELLSRASVVSRLVRVRSLSAGTIGLSRRGMAKLHPEWSEAELLLAWVGLCYGEDLACRLGVFLDRRQR